MSPFFCLVLILSAFRWFLIQLFSELSMSPFCKRMQYFCVTSNWSKFKLILWVLRRNEWDVPRSSDDNLLFVLLSTSFALFDVYTRAFFIQCQIL